MPSASTAVGSARAVAGGATAPRAGRGPSAAAGRCRARGCAAPAPLPGDPPDLVEHLLGGVGVGVGDLAREAHAHRERDQVLLRAVVQVALDAAALARRWPRRCGRASARSSSAWRRTSSSDSCSAESSFTLCSARPTWRASSVSAWSSSSSNGSAPCGTAHDDHAEQLAGVRDRRDAQHRLVVRRDHRRQPHPRPRRPRHAGARDRRSPPRCRAPSSAGPRSGTDTARSSRPPRRASTPRRRSSDIVFFSDSASWSSSSSSGSARVRRLPNVRITSSGACRSP